MIKYKTREEIEILREAALIVSRALGKVAEAIEPGITTLELDAIAEKYIRSQNATPGFLGMYDFPNTLCMSKNNEVVHGYPTNTPLEDGDIISVDCGSYFEGFYGDHAYTFAIGNVSEDKLRLLKVTQECLNIGIEQACIGNRIGDIGYHIQKHAEDNGYGVVRELVGHGVGKEMHEDPQVPNYGKRGQGKKIKEGLVIAIEPMINMGTERVKYHQDGWTILTEDDMPSAHFEHDIAIIDGKPDVLSTFKYVEEALANKKR